MAMLESADLCVPDGRGLDGDGTSTDRVAYLLPTQLQRPSHYPSEKSSVCIGRGIDNASLCAAKGLRMVGETLPSCVVIHPDQLTDPAVANVLVQTDEFEGYISPIEILLNRKYGYALDIWVGDQRIKLPVNSSVEEVVWGVVRHLISCRTLGDGWLEAHTQRLRMAKVRERLRDRKGRFVASSIAAAFAMEPSAPSAQRLLQDLARIRGLATMRVTA